MPISDRLTDKQIRAAKPKEKAYKMSDGLGMFLLVATSGARMWRLKYRIDGKEKVCSFGQYPDVTLSAAREKRREARAMIAAGLDPMAEKRAEREARAEGAADSFASVAEAYFKANSRAWSANHKRDVDRILNELIAGLGHRAMKAITLTDVRKLIATVVDRGALVHARDVRAYFRAVVRHYNAERERPIADPSALVVIPAPPRVQHHHRLPASELGAFLRALEFSDALPMTRLAVRLLLLTGLRTSELRFGQWAEIDTQAKLWRVPASRMKSHLEHLVPLSTQAMALLATLRTMTGSGALLFPNVIDPARPISDMTILAAIYRLGYKGRLSAHGMRGMLSTWANENGHNADAIEAQLAHVQGAVRRSYNSALYLAARLELLQAWADFCDEQERMTNVVQLHAVGSA